MIPFKGRAVKGPAPEDRPKNHVRALPERKATEIRFPVVEGYAFALRKNLIRCHVSQLEPLIIEPSREPTATFVRATVGYQEGSPAIHAAPFQFIQQDREEYYAHTHLQTIEFQIARLIVKSHIDQVVMDNLSWEATASFRLESSDAVSFYARNDHLGLPIPYEYMDIGHSYEPDFLVRLANDMTVVLEIKGFEDDQDKAKHTAAKRRVTAVNNWGQLGKRAFHAPLADWKFGAFMKQ